jgi:hypothetical protein
MSALEFEPEQKAQEKVRVCHVLFGLPSQAKTLVYWQRPFLPEFSRVADQRVALKLLKQQIR